MGNDVHLEAYGLSMLPLPLRR